MTAPTHPHLDEWHRAYIAEASGQSELVGMATHWPLAYIADATPARAVTDAQALLKLTAGAPHVALVDPGRGDVRFTITVAASPLTLADVLPPLQSLGLEVLSEQPFHLTRPDGVDCWLYDFQIARSSTHPGGEHAARLEDAFRAIWDGRAEADAYNRLVVAADLTWREAAVMRAYGQYLHQLRTPWGRGFTANLLVEHAPIARRLSDLFSLRFGRHALAAEVEGVQAALRAQIEAEIDAVESLTADRLLRAFLSLMLATVRTNALQDDRDNHRAIALKLDPSTIEFMPEPRPRFEVFVSSPRIEGIHLRFGQIARGGLRWSDRHEDLRTEILGLANAQVAKNAVIVPAGAKGGFVIKRHSGVDTSPAEQGRAAYREFIGALLDVHDNLDPDSGRPAYVPGTVAYEGGDTYLVVAADKGTATFSDTANEIATKRRFWLGDAFASGGSAGYDHKSMGITAKGAWLSVERHFREMGIDPDTDSFTAVGIGDLSGDVFGNGMLLSRRMKLVAAFDHRHIFIDPDPDPEHSYAERRRLFHLDRSTWADYSPEAISAGGGVHPRSAKSIPIDAQVSAALGLPTETTRMSPAELISAILAAPVDLLWNGGIGTYVKATLEQHSDAGDKANDHVRIDASRVRAKVVGEGGNLGVTQRARVEYSLRGGRINTDALDNSAGVGCSDREVNIKIALQHLVRQGMTALERLNLLESMTDEVADLVLAQNLSLNQMLGQSRQFAADDLALHARQVTDLERRRKLDREQLALPSPEVIAQRRRTGQGLTSPELAVLSAQVKLDLRDQLLRSNLPDDHATQGLLDAYFPTAMRSRHHEAIQQHPLRREIVATELANAVVDSAGIGWIHRMLENTTATADDVVRAYLVVVQVFDLPQLWARIHTDDVPTNIAGEMIWESTRVLDRATRWMLNRRPQPLQVDAEVARLRPTVVDLSAGVPEWHNLNHHIDYQERLDAVVADDSDPELASIVFGLLERFCLLDVAEISHDLGRPAHEAAELYYLVKERREIDLSLTGISRLPRNDRWSALARLGLRDDLYESIRAIVSRVLRGTHSDESVQQALKRWESSLGERLTMIESLIVTSRSGDDLANLVVAARQIRTLALLTN